MSSKAPYHHGDLPTALVRAAIELLEEGGATALSLRAAARRAGVSTAAPYRHFADRAAILSAVATVGYQELLADLIAASPDPSTIDDLADIAIAYVRFALKKPGLFRAMFTEQCDITSPDRVTAVAEITTYLHTMVTKVRPASDSGSMAIAMWSLVHGLAFLFLDGKLDSSSDDAVETQIRGVVATLTASVPG
ncbi:TetR/AcrR family transcriptional regulator [Gordonia sp. TBRC 11910]|uniref:TetR/AcrR family transcriptional regulator n=1 Tax=Gordonia asplenii TaxID=2725283 RepID=A0A848KWN9_9ACTN|nr:TetR/AcrR family transcriptional regulator [Gordonia asplenii]NMO02662.1 TetR/AcrR family transcriptional regulator [Gordonia asplenii]